MLLVSAMGQTLSSHIMWNELFQKKFAPVSRLKYRNSSFWRQCWGKNIFFLMMMICFGFRNLRGVTGQRIYFLSFKCWWCPYLEHLFLGADSYLWLVDCFRLLEYIHVNRFTHSGTHSPGNLAVRVYLFLDLKLLFSLGMNKCLWLYVFPNTHFKGFLVH